MRNPAGIKLFGNHLRSLRIAKGYSQQALADIANIEKSTVKRIEQAKFSPTFDVIISLCRALDIKINDMLDLPEITNLDSEITSG